jgi:hypothetical protein
LHPSPAQERAGRSLFSVQGTFPSVEGCAWTALLTFKSAEHVRCRTSPAPPRPSCPRVTRRSPRNSWGRRCAAAAEGGLCARSRAVRARRPGNRAAGWPPRCALGALRRRAGAGPFPRWSRAPAAPQCAGASPGAECAGAGREDRPCAGLERGRSARRRWWRRTDRPRTDAQTYKPASLGTGCGIPRAAPPKGLATSP